MSTAEVLTLTSEIEYRDIPGFPGYRATSEGHIESCWTSGSHGGMQSQWRRMLPWVTRDGRFIVGIYRNGTRSRRPIHRLVCEAFHGPCPAGCECCHNDGCCTNNVPFNLRWDTHKRNCVERREQGSAAIGERNGNAFLTASDVCGIRMMGASGIPQRAIAMHFAITQASVSLIIRGESWRHVLPEVSHVCK